MSERMTDSLNLLSDKFSEGWHDGIEIDASDILLLGQAADEIETLRVRVRELEVRINKACDELELLRDNEIEIIVPDSLPQIDDILFDLEGGEASFNLELCQEKADE